MLYQLSYNGLWDEGWTRLHILKFRENRHKIYASQTNIHPWRKARFSEGYSIFEHLYFLSGNMFIDENKAYGYFHAFINL